MDVTQQTPWRDSERQKEEGRLPGPSAGRTAQWQVPRVALLPLYITDRVLHACPTWNCQQAQTQKNLQQKPAPYSQKDRERDDLTTKIFLAILTLLQWNTSRKTTPPSLNWSHPTTLCSVAARGSTQILLLSTAQPNLPSQLGRDRWFSNSPTGCCPWAE